MAAKSLSLRSILGEQRLTSAPALLRSDDSRANIRRRPINYGFLVRSARKPKKVSPKPASARSVDTRPAAGALLDETIAIWQPRASRRLTREDARQIIENMTGFFNVLRDWDRAERAAAAASDGPKQAPHRDVHRNEVMLEEAP